MKLMQETKGVAQNTESVNFSASQMPKKIQHSFLKRAQIPSDYNTCGIFGMIFHKNHLKEGTFKYQKLT